MAHVCREIFENSRGDLNRFLIFIQLRVSQSQLSARLRVFGKRRRFSGQLNQSVACFLKFLFGQKRLSFGKASRQCVLGFWQRRGLDLSGRRFCRGGLLRGGWRRFVGNRNNCFVGHRWLRGRCDRRGGRRGQRCGRHNSRRGL